MYLKWKLHNHFTTIMGAVFCRIAESLLVFVIPNLGIVCSRVKFALALNNNSHLLHVIIVNKTLGGIVFAMKFYKFRRQ